MPRFLIEVPHENTVGECIRAAEVFLTTGSHFLSHADWGCMDGEHKAWIVADLDSKAEALSIVPPLFRSRARVVQLTAFTLEGVAELRRKHGS